MSHWFLIESLFKIEDFDLAWNILEGEKVSWDIGMEVGVSWNIITRVGVSMDIVIEMSFLVVILAVGVVVSQIVLNKSEQSLEYNWMPWISTARTLEE